jgi:hypothetical protein
MEFGDERRKMIHRKEGRLFIKPEAAFSMEKRPFGKLSTLPGI